MVPHLHLPWPPKMWHPHLLAQPAGPGPTWPRVRGGAELLGPPQALRCVCVCWCVCVCVHRARACTHTPHLCQCVHPQGHKHAHGGMAMGMVHQCTHRSHTRALVCVNVNASAGHLWRPHGHESTGAWLCHVCACPPGMCVWPEEGGVVSLSALENLGGPRNKAARIA